uniref:(California timema) hypothetical protein n=1 Tax=Timema californicum TaxID=61474 RepID=A0A7R9P756_TIMCA|nr:unnamed protein product [Timema californicum]
MLGINTTPEKISNELHYNNKSDSFSLVPLTYRLQRFVVKCFTNVKVTRSDVDQIAPLAPLLSTSPCFHLPVLLPVNTHLECICRCNSGEIICSHQRTGAGSLLGRLVPCYNRDSNPDFLCKFRASFTAEDGEIGVKISLGAPTPSLIVHLLATTAQHTLDPTIIRRGRRHSETILEPHQLIVLRTFTSRSLPCGPHDRPPEQDELCWFMTDEE